MGKDKDTEAAPRTQEELNIPGATGTAADGRPSPEGNVTPGEKHGEGR